MTHNTRPLSPRRGTRACSVALAAIAHAAVALAAVALVGCAAGSTTPSTPSVLPQPTVSEQGPVAPRDVVTGLAAPWSVVRVGESAIVSERDAARILEFTPGGDIREIAVVDGVVTGGEGGLLGLAVAPDESSLYAYSTAQEGNRVHRYPLQGAPVR